MNYWAVLPGVAMATLLLAVVVLKFIWWWREKKTLRLIRQGRSPTANRLHPGEFSRVVRRRVLWAAVPLIFGGTWIVATLVDPARRTPDESAAPAPTAATTTEAPAPPDAECPHWLAECDPQLQEAWEHATNPNSGEQSRRRRLAYRCQLFVAAVSASTSDWERVVSQTEVGLATGRFATAGFAEVSYAAEALRTAAWSAILATTNANDTWSYGLEGDTASGAWETPWEACTERRGAVRRESGERCDPPLRAGQEDCVITWASLTPVTNPHLDALSVWGAAVRLRSDEALRALLALAQR